MMGADSARQGLAPADAQGWLRLQRIFAWSPEQIAPQLEAGWSPDEILASATGRRAIAHASVDPAPRGQRDPAWHLACLDELGVRIVPRPDPAYPERLAALVDAPPVLMVRGEASSLGSLCVAIVGARAATQTARQTARRLGRELAACGVTIVSGLARGIDAEAHRGALEAGGRTIAVLACGLDQVYPPEHRRLAQEICERGAVVSEMPIGAKPRRAHFPLRNRLISGLSVGVIVVEARRRSGSLITVRHALNQGREVFVVPGSVVGPFAEGTNHLLREGARPIRDARDVLEDLRLEMADPTSTSTESAPHAGVESVSGRIRTLLESGPLSRDALAERLVLPPGELARALLELELVHRVVEDRDGCLHLDWS